MSTIHPTRPLSELRNTKTRSCTELGIYQNPYALCPTRCELASRAKLRQPTPLPTLAPGVLDGPYSRSRHAQALRKQCRVTLVWWGVVATGLAFWVGVAYAVL